MKSVKEQVRWQVRKQVRNQSAYQIDVLVWNHIEEQYWFQIFSLILKKAFY